VSGADAEARGYWLDPEAAALPEEAGLVRELGPAERSLLARRAHPEARRAFLVARALLRRTLAARLGAVPAEVALAGGGSEPIRLLAPHGARGLHASLAHTRGLVVCAVGNAPVGVDVERLDRPVRALALARRFFSGPEARALADVPEEGRGAAFLRVWTAKEAGLKACGRGLAGGLADVVVEPGADGRPTLRVGRRAFALALAEVGAHGVALASSAPHARLAWAPGPALFEGAPDGARRAPA